MEIKYLEDIVQYPLEFKENWLSWQEYGFQFSASGYGTRIPTRYMVKYRGTWRRVYAIRKANAASAYIISKGERLFIRDFPHA